MSLAGEILAPCFHVNGHSGPIEQLSMTCTDHVDQTLPPSFYVDLRVPFEAGASINELPTWLQDQAEDELRLTDAEAHVHFCDADDCGVALVRFWDASSEG